ncbi:helix-turn-helix domain-containing protein [Salinigranum salinum]|uniref:helix-turn-helix domain-containing protein n=1 Tax=Salinigranum salinum TaxID=1364937 RepID=UPI001260D1DA|nr:helix-turn-helix domain-containing protein [Salinigranum salinum]
MKSLRLRLHPAPDAVHPMHEFVVRHEGYTRSRLVTEDESEPGAGSSGGSGSPDDADDEPRALLFHVEGPDPRRDAYADALRDTDSVVDFELDRRDRTLYAYVLEDRSPFDERLAATFSRLRLVVVPPVDFAADRSIRLTVVGSASAVQSAVSAVPERIETDVRRVGGFDGTVVDPTGGAALTERQREAVEAAVEVGYYGATREGSVAAVAEALNCSTGTAAEHLRKAEARVMRAVVGEQ